MIGRIRGVLIDKKPPLLVIEIQGLGYEVEVPTSTFSHLPELNAEVSLYTHFLVREDAQLLYGFLTEYERRLFRELLKVSGIGAKLALTILSAGSPDELIFAINSGHTTQLTKLPGIGKKTAERLVVEMRDKLGDWTPGLPLAVTAAQPVVARNAVAEAISALVGLGYKLQEARLFIQTFETEGLSSEAIIREALKVAARM
jgi:holliday junction DNA helicase RuvA